MFLSKVIALLVAVTQCLASGQSPLQEQSSTRHLSLVHDVIGFHKNLTEIESITGNEDAVGKWLAASLKSQGYNTELQYLQQDPPRFNILAWPGKTRDARVLLSSHIDTVPPFYPYTHHNSTISGRGSVDDKGSVAAQVLAINKLLSDDTISADDITFLFVAGEETGGDGMRKANELDLHPDTIIFGEPTEGKLAAGHKGNLGFVLKAKGKAGHSGYPWLGRSANEVLVKALLALMELGSTLPSSEKYGVTTLNIGRVEGGVAYNVIAQDAAANILVRIAAGTPEDIKKAITRGVHMAVQPFLEGDVKVEDVVELQFMNAGYGPIDIDHDVPGIDAITVNYGTDIPWLHKTVPDQKRYLYGPGSILVAHSDHEALTESQLYDAVSGYEKIVLHALDKAL